MADHIENLCSDHLASLFSYDLIESDHQGGFKSTSLGRAVANSYVSIKTVITLHEKFHMGNSMEQVLMTLASAEEFA